MITRGKTTNMNPIRQLLSIGFISFFAPLVLMTDALDLEFNSIQCDTTLPAFAYDGDIQVTCYDDVNGGTRKRCSLGQQILISGRLQYRDLTAYFPTSYDADADADGYAYDGANSNNTIGYASANLTLATIEYGLFQYLPFNFCGDWVRQYQTYQEQYNNNDGGYDDGSSSSQCPSDGIYMFQVPYVLPFDDFDIASWFATGWSGASDLVIYNDPDVTNTERQELVNCRLHWSTYVTESPNSDGWAAFPSAAQVAIVLASIAAFLCLCCTWLTCCRSNNDQVTDEEYTKEFQTMDGDDRLHKLGRSDDYDDDDSIPAFRKKKKKQNLFALHRLQHPIRAKKNRDWDFNVEVEEQRYRRGWFEW
mmetsp:Transcript_2533/g.5520  ORF Transcript_2533/g.5520 Transcript_2533/m.5520 type:complete len:363 (-) Transcript_2533:207-1295(-)